MLELVLEILKIIIPSLIVFLTAYLIIKSFMEKEYRLRQFDLRYKNQKDVIPIRLQAYERLTMLLERITPGNLIQRVRRSEMSAKELQIALVANIRAEYEHNLSQQIYVSTRAWDTTVLVKDEIIKIINLVATSLPNTASSLDLSRAILEYYMNAEGLLPNQRALDVLKAEVQSIYL